MKAGDNSTVDNQQDTEPVCPDCSECLRRKEYSFNTHYTCPNCHNGWWSHNLDNLPAHHKVKHILEYEYRVESQTAFRYARPIKQDEYEPDGW